MGFIRNTSRLADRLLGILTGLLALVLLAYSCYVLLDNHYKGQAAFVSRELLRYKPSVNTEGVYDFTELQKINKDVMGWITLYDTNINYPVVQGTDDMEYINKDVYGKSSLTGSIYLSAVNNNELKDMYNIIYGHHMDNGSLFGDVAKYTDKRFFDAHRDGEFLTPAQAYKLRVFACLETNAYESKVYSVTTTNKSEINRMIDYVKENSLYFDRVDDTDVEKIVALSTCSDIRTNGRVVIFCDAVPKKESVPADPTPTDYNDGIILKQAEGHDTIGDGWALLNLICVIVLLYTLLPFGSIRRKYRQLPYSRSKSKEFKEQSDLLKEDSDKTEHEYSTDNVTENDDKIIPDRFIANSDAGYSDSQEQNENISAEELQEISDDLAGFVRKIIVGIVIELLVLIFGTVFFFLTENIHSAMKFSDDKTLLMILMTMAALTVDFVFFRYRGKRPLQPKTMEKAENNALDETDT